MFRLTLGAVLAATTIVSAASAQDTSTALGTVQAFYAERTPPRAGLAAHFVPDLAAAMETDLGGRQPLLAPDYRFDLGERPRGDFTFAEGESVNGASVTVEFSDGRVFVDLCRRADGQWRIADIKDPEDFWSTRGYMGLHLGQVQCE